VHRLAPATLVEPGAHCAHAEVLPKPKVPAAQVWQADETPSTKKVPLPQHTATPAALQCPCGVPPEQEGVQVMGMDAEYGSPLKFRSAAASVGDNVRLKILNSSRPPLNRMLEPLDDLPIQLLLYVIWAVLLESVNETWLKGPPEERKYQLFVFGVVVPWMEKQRCTHAEFCVHMPALLFVYMLTVAWVILTCNEVPPRFETEMSSVPMMPAARLYRVCVLMLSTA
jgi:hypothetical protein